MLRHILHSLEKRVDQPEASQTANAIATQTDSRRLSFIASHASAFLKLVVSGFLILTIVLYIYFLIFSKDPSRTQHLLSVAGQLATALALEHSGADDSNKTLNSTVSNITRAEAYETD